MPTMTVAATAVVVTKVPERTAAQTRLMDLFTAREAQGGEWNRRLAVPDDIGRQDFFAVACDVRALEEATVDNQAGLIEVEAVINTNEVDRYQTIVEPRGGRFDNYKRNPVLLWSHGMDAAFGFIPIGQVKSLTVKDTEVVAKIVFFDTKLGRDIGNLYAKRQCRGFSIGFIPLSYTIELVNERPIIRYVEWDLVELSACSVPANASSLARSLSSGELSLNCPQTLDELSAMNSLEARGENPWDVLRRALMNQRALPAAAVREVPPDETPAAPEPVPASDAVSAATEVPPAEPVAAEPVAPVEQTPTPAVTDTVVTTDVAPASVGATPEELAAAEAAADKGTIRGNLDAMTVDLMNSPLTMTAAGGSGAGTMPAPTAAARDAQPVVVATVAPATAAGPAVEPIAIGPGISTHAPAVRVLMDQQYDASAITALTPDQQDAACAYVADVPDGKFRAYPHHVATGEASWAGVLAQMNRVLTDGEAPEPMRREAYEHLAGHYREIGAEAPAFGSYSVEETYRMAVEGRLAWTGPDGKLEPFTCVGMVDSKGRGIVPLFRGVLTGRDAHGEAPKGTLADPKLWGQRRKTADDVTRAAAPVVTVPEATGVADLQAVLARMNPTVKAVEAVATQVRKGAEFSRKNKEMLRGAANDFSDMASELKRFAGTLNERANSLRQMVEASEESTTVETDDSVGESRVGGPQVTAASEPSDGLDVRQAGEILSQVVADAVRKEAPNVVRNATLEARLANRRAGSRVFVPGS
jgi:hypothetical protein